MDEWENQRPHYMLYITFVENHFFQKTCPFLLGELLSPSGPLGVKGRRERERRERERGERERGERERRRLERKKKKKKEKKERNLN